MKFEAHKIEEIRSFLQEEDEFLLLSHVLPDGDNIGSMIAFAEMLKTINKRAVLLLRDPVPEIYKFLLCDNIVFNLDTIGNTIPENFIVLDCSEFERLGEEMQFLRQKAKMILNIDHHVSNDGFGDLKIINKDAAAACEVLYHLFVSLDIEFNPQIARALYTGIVTDTGGFRYENTSAGTFFAAAELIKQGVDLGEIRENIYENNDLISIIILQKALTNLRLSADRRLAWLYVSAQDMEEANASGEHCEGIVNYALSIAGVKMGFFFREMPDGKIKVGLRARRGHNVNTLAALFGGGGHALASGCTLNGSLEDAIHTVITAAENSLKG